MSAGLKPLRVGFAGKVKPSLLQFTPESEMERHPLRTKYEQLRERVKELEKSIKELIARLRDYKKAGNSRFSQRVQAMEEDVLWKEKQVASLDRRAYGIYMTMLRDVVTQADVVSHLVSLTDKQSIMTFARFVQHALRLLLIDLWSPISLWYSLTRLQCQLNLRR